MTYAERGSPATSFMIPSISWANALVSSPPFLETATEDLLLELSEMGRVVAAVALPRRTAGKLKKEPKSRLNKLGLAQAMECICKRTKRRRQTLKKWVRRILYTQAEKNRKGKWKWIMLLKTYPHDFWRMFGVRSIENLAGDWHRGSTCCIVFK